MGDAADNYAADASNEAALIERARGGEREAIASLLALHGPTVRSRLFGQIGSVWQSVLEIDDVLQVTYLEAFLQISRFEPRGEGAFLAWLTHIAENNLRDAIRGLERAKRPDPRRQVRQAVSDESYVEMIEILGMTTTTPSRVAARGEAAGALEIALRRLPPDYEKTVRMYDLECRSIEDVAEALGRRPGAVYMLRARAHERLRDILGSEGKFLSVKG
ncbi:MAG: RNA polymerase sigma factor [Phycisphaerales bacterium]|jgi:RNA polymerase sigma-70 factor (ECF subfamily)|nr:RNA polymerase sigma factor [Phycisphaerales bacterium]